MRGVRCCGCCVNGMSVWFLGRREGKWGCHAWLIILLMMMMMMRIRGSRVMRKRKELKGDGGK